MCGWLKLPLYIYGSYMVDLVNKDIDEMVVSWV
jgi:hypothetical protein